MLAALRDFFDREVATPRETPGRGHALELATAALLAEVMRLDGASDAERGAVLDAVRQTFGLSDAEAGTLCELAEAEARDAVGYYQFTSLVNRHFGAEEKARIVELMWRVAYVDATLSAHEQHVIRKIADLLHVPHGAYIAAKLRARTAAETPGRSA